MSRTRPLTIGDVARDAGVKVATIRYYEEVGLLPTPGRTAGNRRSYDARDVLRLRFVRNARDLGFDLDAVRQLLALAGMPDQACEGADQIARERLAQVKSKIAKLRDLRKELEGMVVQGRHGSIRECRVIEVLASG